MLKSYNTIFDSNETEIVVNRSRFIANIKHVESHEEANDFIKSIKAKYHDAKHNCYAYRLSENSFEKCSDDGEPSSTAGMPILKILQSENLFNVCIVVTRYFGGVLLGTGGLVRAYTDSSKSVVDNTKLYESVFGKKYKVELNYSQNDLVQNFMNKNQFINIDNIEYMENVIITFIVNNNEDENILNNIKNLINEDKVKYICDCCSFI